MFQHFSVTEKCWNIFSVAQTFFSGPHIFSVTPCARNCAQVRPSCAAAARSCASAAHQLCRNCTTAVLQLRPSCAPTAGAAAFTTPSSLGVLINFISHPKYDKRSVVMYGYMRACTYIQDGYSHKHILTYSNAHILTYVDFLFLVEALMQLDIIITYIYLDVVAPKN